MWKKPLTSDAFDFFPAQEFSFFKLSIWNTIISSRERRKKNKKRKRHKLTAMFKPLTRKCVYVLCVSFYGSVFCGSNYCIVLIRITVSSYSWSIGHNSLVDRSNKSQIIIFLGCFTHNFPPWKNLFWVKRKKEEKKRRGEWMQTLYLFLYNLHVVYICLLIYFYFYNDSPPPPHFVRIM